MINLKYKLPVNCYALILLLVATFPLLAYGSNRNIDLDDLPLVESVDLFAIDSNIKEIIDRSVGDIPNAKERAHALHVLLFNENYLGIKYGDFRTQTAQETFDSGVGNCISLASLYVAAARHVGLDAKFQAVEVPTEWVEEKSYYIVPSHINVAVETSKRGRELIVEFTDIYMAKDTRLFPSEVISDKRVLAEYYNNIGMEYMSEGRLDVAMAYLQKSTKTYGKVAFVWSNLGVVYKSTGYLDAAELAYKKGLRLDRQNLSILNNLYVLYRQAGKNKDADKLARKVERYSRKNPYYLAKLADSEVRLKNHSAAIPLLRKAIKANQSEPRFHLMLASIYLNLGEYSKSIEQVSEARNIAGLDDQARFQKKIAYIKAVAANERVDQFF